MCRASTAASCTFSRRRRKLAGTTDFIVDNHRINIADDEVFARDPGQPRCACSGSPTGTGWNITPTR